MLRSAFLIGGLFVFSVEASAIDVCQSGACDFLNIDAALESIPDDGADTINVVDAGVYTQKIEPTNNSGVTVLIITTTGASINGGLNDQIKSKNDSHLTFDGFDLNGAVAGRRCAQVDDTSSLTLINMTIHDCTKGDDGAGLRVNGANASAFIYDSTFTTIAQTNGGKDGGHIYTKGDLHIERTTFTGGTSARHGAGIYVEGARAVTLIDVTFTDFDSADDGGAYYAPDAPTTVMENVLFERVGYAAPIASLGGAIYQDGGSLTIDGGTFVAMEVSNQGGAMYLDSVTAILDDITVTDAVATGLAEGAGIWALNTTLTITGVAGPSLFQSVAEFGNDVAVRGGGIHCNNGNLTLSDTSFDNLQASEEAAGIFTTGSCTADIDNGAFNGNVVGGDGDGAGLLLRSTGNHSVVNSDFIGNVSADKGALQAEAGGFLDLSNNLFDGNSGGLGAHMYLEIDTSDVGSTYRDGLAGGGVRTETAIDVDFDNSTFENNVSGALDGGAIYMNASGTLSLVDCQFTTNDSNLNGGAVYLGTNVSAFITDTTFMGNTADGDGGAVTWLPGGLAPSLTVSGSTFISNVADIDGDATGDGGAIFMESSGSASIIGSSFAFNNAENGGAVRLKTARDSVMYRNNWCRNDAAADGGALYVESGAQTHDLQNNAFVDNDAVAGAAVFAIGATLDVVNNTAAGNDSSANQGAWYFNGTTLTFVNNATTHSTNLGLFTVGSTYTTRSYNHWFSNDGSHLGGDFNDGADLGQPGTLLDVDPLYVSYTEDAICDDELWLRTNPPYASDSLLIDAGNPALFDNGDPLNPSDIGAFGGEEMDADLFFDGDGDGFSAATGDCDDNDILVFPGAIENQGDGVDQDCDGLEECYLDADDDGFGDDAATIVLSFPLDCSAANVSGTADDCEDGLPLINPAAIEITADFTDQDCNGFEDCYEDLDGDFHGSAVVVPSAQLNCIAPGVWFLGDDCDDTNPAINPDASELTADGVDQNCDGGEQCYLDGDGDDYGLPATFPSADLDCDDALEAYNSLDCNDLDSQINPIAVEIPADLVDQNCDSNEDCYLDADSDGHGVTPTAIIVSVGNVSCANEVNESTLNDDCDDTNPLVNPSEAEIVANGVDDECDGFELCFVDGDGDTYGDIGGGTIASGNLSCLDGGESPSADDCNDGNPAIHPNAAELTGDRVDSDCDGFESCFDDVDSDGFGTTSTHLSTSVDCDLGSESLLNTDCDDADPFTNPLATEIVADGKDQTCDGFEECYADDDGDSFAGDIATALSASLTCTGVGISATIDDCDDVDPAIFPGAVEIPADDTDQNCDGVEDCYEDLDGDTYGSGVIATSVALDCTDPNRSPLTTDCDDTDIAIHPAAIEGVADGVDQNCDNQEECYADADGDTYAGSTTTGLTPQIDCNIVGFGPIPDDCDDTNPAINPAAAEIPADLVDQDCNGRELCFVDADNDTYGTTSTQLSVDMLCLTIRGHSLNNLDCNDGNPDAYPGALELVASGIDEDCDGREICFDDGDDDGFGINAQVDSQPGDETCAGSNVALTNDDCNDINATIFPGALELPANGVDDDCDTMELCYEDGDQDTFGSTLTILSPDLVCTDLGESILSDDCDDTDPTRYPGAPEVVEDGIDQDCDGFDLQGCFQDLDGDGFGSGLVIGSNDPTCSGVGESLLQSDCDDSNAAINPNANDYCDGVDDNCDGFGGPTSDEDTDGLDWITEVALGLDGCLFDSDGDTLGDGDELNILLTDPGNSDSDGDGVDDGVEVGGNPLNPTNTDGDGLIDALDDDDDDDGVPTLAEDRNANGDPTDDDTDSDGFPDYLDTDDDGDGLLTLDDEDLNRDGDPTNDDWDGDGVPNYLDLDDDGDTIPTADEIPVGGDPFSLDGDGDGIPDEFEWVFGDTDGDGIFDIGDGDDDGDGIATIEEGDGFADADGDGIPNYRDLDSDNDGKLDETEGTGDDDGDGIPNFIDPDDNDGGAADNDGDGIITSDERDIGSDQLDPDTDGDGVDDGTEIVDPLNPLDTDGDDLEDVFDTDDDGDGIDTRDELGLECLDGSDVQVLVRPGPIPEMYFLCDDGTELGARSYQDTDSDGIPDYLDADDDGDGIPTLDEDVNGDGDWTDDDIDGDGIPDYIDLSDDDGPLGDLDDDGLANAAEEGDDMDPTSPDSDGDGVLDGLEYQHGDTDGDGIIDPLDTDDDGDGIDTLEEGMADTDGDGVPNYLDEDSDGDAKSDEEEGTGDDDCDGIQNYVDSDDADHSCGDSGLSKGGSDVITNDGGCGCDGGGSAGGAWWLVIGALLAIRRRKTA